MLSHTVKEVKPNAVGVAGGCRVAEGGAIKWLFRDLAL